MTRSSVLGESPVLFLDGKTAQDLMTANVVSIGPRATIADAVALLMEKELNAVPVIDDHGEAVGVLSRSDIVAYDRQFYRRLHDATSDGQNVHPMKFHNPDTGIVDTKGDLLVGDIMSEVIYSVSPRTPAKSVVDGMLALGIHRLFVADERDKLVGVISSTDILRQLHEPTAVCFEAVELLEIGAGRTRGVVKDGKPGSGSM